MRALCVTKYRENSDMKKLLLIACSTFFSLEIAIAGQFVAVCEADGVHAYRNTTDISGEPLGAEWSEGEKFSGKFRFAFDGGVLPRFHGRF